MSENFPTGEQRIHSFIKDTQDKSRESFELHAEVELLHMVQDRLRMHYGETVHAQYQAIWDKTLGYLASKPMDDTTADIRGVIAYWNFESIVESDDTQVQLTTTVQAGPIECETNKEMAEARIAIWPPEKQAKYPGYTNPKEVLGVKMRGFRVDPEQARMKLRCKLAEELLRDPTFVRAEVKMQALGYDEQPKKIIDTAVFRSQVDPDVVSYIETFTPEGTMKLLQAHKQRRQAEGKFDIDMEQLTYVLTVDLQSYDQRVRPAFMRLNEVNDILDLSH